MHVRSIQEYLEVRRDTIGAKPSFAILELDMDLPDEAVHHPVIEELSIVTIDMILLGNVGCAYFGCVTRLTTRWVT
jgi:Delta6-protoilludene synthase